MFEQPMTPEEVAMMRGLCPKLAVIVDAAHQVDATDLMFTASTQGCTVFDNPTRTVVGKTDHAGEAYNVIDMWWAERFSNDA